jgi:hypothetical protein
MSDAEQRWEPFFRPVPIAPGTADESKGRPPRAFLSYAWESRSHTNWVISLAERLQGKSGVEIILDQWKLIPGRDRLVFMEQGIEESDFVIVVCTPAYAERANSREGGVGYESMVITSAVASRFQNHKFIPVLRSGGWHSSVPVYLRSIEGVDLQGDPYSEVEYEKLVRAIHNDWTQPPPLGPKPAFSGRANQTSTTSGPSDWDEPPESRVRAPQPNYVSWRDSDPGPCMDVIVRNSHEVIAAGSSIGLEYPEPIKMRALLDTGASVTVVSKTFARYCKLLQTGETEIRALGSLHRCGEHAGAISFPGTNLRPYDPIRIVSADFVQERHYAILIGRDILRNWRITFDGVRGCVAITDLQSFGLSEGES